MKTVIVTPEPTEMETLSKEIDSAIDGVVEANKAEKAKAEKVKTEDVVEDEPKEDLPEGEALPPEKEEKSPEGKTKVDENAQSVTITDSHIERAVKAGISMADAKAFTSPEALERVCGMLEGKPERESKSADGKDENETDEVVALLDGIPDLDPENYDDNIVAGFKAMKSVIKRLSDDNKELRQSGSRQEVDWLDSQIQGLGEDYADVVGSGAKGSLQAGSPEAVKRAEIERKFKVLEAGYKAAGEEASRESVFKEAVSLTLGESVAKVKTAKKEEALKSREKLIIARADGSRATPKRDALDETADEIDRKHFGKK